MSQKECCEKLGFNEKKKTNNESKTIVSREIFANASVCF